MRCDCTGSRRTNPFHATASHTPTRNGTGANHARKRRATGSSRESTLPGFSTSAREGLAAEDARLTWLADSAAPELKLKAHQGRSTEE